MRAIATRVLGLAPGAGWRVAGLVGLGLCVTATYVAQGLLLARVLAEVFQGGDVASILLKVGGIVVLQGLRAVLLATREACAFAVSGVVKEAARERLTVKLLELGPGSLQRTRTGSMQATIVDAVEHLDPFVGRFLPEMFACALGALGVTAYMIVLDPLAGTVILVFALGAPLAYLGSWRYIDNACEGWSEAYRDVYSGSLDAIQGMATLKAFNASRRRGAELRERAERLALFANRVTAVWCWTAGLAELVVPIGTAAAIGIGILHAADGTLTITQLFTILFLTRECFRPLGNLQTAFHAGYKGISGGKEILKLLDTPPDVVEPPQDGRASPMVPADQADIRFIDVSFAYRERSEPALSGFSLRVAPGERVALVGRSGSGKTTVVSLLLRFFELDEGRILVGGRDIRDLALSQLRALVSVVAQDTYLFHGSVRDNLLVGRADADDHAIEAAARAARAHEFIRELPNGYDTVIGERGLKLSGGERQRIAIARALLKDAPILVLDEPTSSVDAANEAEIQHALDRLSRGRATLVIAHRLSTVRDADRILVLGAGRVLEEGSHQSLFDAQGAYAQLVAAQSEPVS
ncbi:MAG: ABC transporter ATP-binding protein [Egibacteraceae bacterium]